MNIIYYLIIAFVMTRIPILRVYVRLINTMIHEVCHIIVATITGGKGHKITLHRDTSGLALTSSSSWFSRVFTAYAGYTGSSLVAFLLFYLLQEGYYTVVLLVLMSVLIIATLLWVRNGFGSLWAASFLLLIWLLIDKQFDQITIHLSYLLSAVLLVESVSSALQVMLISFKQPKDAGDATALQKFTFIPALIWGILFFIQSIYIGYKIVLQHV